MVKKIIKEISPRFLIGWYHFLWAFLSALLCGFPSRKIKVIGITGTNGKTTTIDLSARILEEAGYKVAAASSIKFKIGEKEEENKLKMTMPGRFVLQRFLRQAVKANCQYALIEVTSEGVLQHRHQFINFQAVVFTNLSPEHIERHGSFENYRAAKLKFFRAVRSLHIVNLDDENAGYFLKNKAVQKFVYRINKEKPGAVYANQDWRVVEADDVVEESQGLKFTVQDFNFFLPLFGYFNIYNALAALSVALSQGVSLEICQKALAEFIGVSGRMEEIIKQPFRVVVDYAFTPNALEQVYQTFFRQSHSITQPLNHSTTRLICVLGACGGGRDKWKRKVLGEIAGKYCQEVIITNEDPYDENPMEIISQVAGGVGLKARKILDRREAIIKALELAKPGDTVIITGKGCEPWICVGGGKKIPWDDRQVVREELENITIFDRFNLLFVFGVIWIQNVLSGAT